MADGRGRAVSRRAALATIAAGLGLGAAACGGFRLGSTRPVGDDVLLFTTWATLMSGALLSSLPVLLLFVVAQRSFVTGLARSGLK